MTLAAASVPARILATASAHADHLAIIDGECRLTYRALADQVRQSTRAMIAARVRPGDRVAVWAPNGARWIVAAVSILGAGGVLVPISTRVKAVEAADVLRRTRACLLLTDTAFLGIDFAGMLREELLASETGLLPDLGQTVVLDGPAGENTSWPDFLAGGEAVPAAEAEQRTAGVRGDDVADVLFTSGTTGRPKGALSTHAQLLQTFDSWTELVGLTSRDRYLVATPFSHSFGYKAGWLASALVGATVVPVAALDLPALPGLIEREQITFLPGPPTLLQDLLDARDRGSGDLSSLRTTVIGAATVPVDLVRRLLEDGVFQTVLTGYGLTETNGPATICRRDDDATTIATTAGRPLPDTEVRVVTPDGNAPAPGEPGEVLLRGYHVMVGYLDDDAATTAAIDADGWLHTGDLGVLDERGYLTITGRLKEMFTVGGFNVYPAEVEGLLLGDRRLAAAAVVGVPDARLGEVGAAFVVPRAGATVTSADVLAAARTRMANYKVPHSVTICSQLPTNALGKVQKDRLLAMETPETWRGGEAPTP